MDERKNNFLDAVSIISFIIGVLNYGENVDQSTMNEAVQKAVQDIHDHLTEQDEKINAIMGKLGIKKGEE